MFPELLARANRLRQSGDLLQAEQMYRQFLTQFPGHAQAQYLLAVTCHQLGRLTDALPLYQQAAQLNPNSGECRRNLAVALHQAGRTGEAMASIREALRISPEDVESYFWLGNFLNEQGHFDEAVVALEKATRLRPTHSRAQSELGRALRREERLPEAVACYREALRLQPSDVIALDRLGAALSETGNIADAVETYHQALRIKPDYVMALHNLAELHRRSLYQLSDAEMAEIKKLVSNPSLSATDRSLICFALAYVAERAGLYDEAFANFRQGNDCRKRLLQERGLAYDGPARSAWLDRTIQFFTPEYFQRVAPYGLESELPVFIVGMPRSGTTLAEQILASHPQVHGAGELTDIQRLSENLQANLAMPYPVCLAHWSPASLQASAEHYLKRLESKANTAHAGHVTRVIDKMPENYLHLGLIATLLPRARVIWCHRNPLDTCVSCYTQSFYATRLVLNLEELGAYYRAHERLMAHWRAVLPVRIFELQYEELVHDQERVVRNLLDFCGLPWDAGCLAFHENPRPVQTASRFQVRQPMHTRSIGSWKKYERHLAPLIEVLQH